MEASCRHMRTPLAFVPAFAKALLVADLGARHGTLVSARAKVHGLARPMHREGACNAACGQGGRRAACGLTWRGLGGFSVQI